MSYGADIDAVWERAAGFVDKILKDELGRGPDTVEVTLVNRDVQGAPRVFH